MNPVTGWLLGLLVAIAAILAWFLVHPVLGVVVYSPVLVVIPLMWRDLGRGW